MGSNANDVNERGIKFDTFFMNLNAGVVPAKDGIADVGSEVQLGTTLSIGDSTYHPNIAVQGVRFYGPTSPDTTSLGLSLGVQKLVAPLNLSISGNILPQWGQHVIGPEQISYQFDLGIKMSAYYLVKSESGGDIGIGLTTSVLDIINDPGRIFIGLGAEVRFR